MSTTRTFQDMLNEYLPNKLMKEELLQRDWLLQNVNKDEKWKGGKIIVPFKAAGASSIKMGALTAASDIAEENLVRGSIDAYVEMWGSMIFNHRDILDHSGRVVEDSFLSIFPDMLEDFMASMKQTASIQLGTGPHFSVVRDATNAATGILIVSHIDRFELGQKVTLDDDNSAAASYYVTAINVNLGSSSDPSSGTITLSATRGGAAADVSAYSVAQVAKLYTDGAEATYFTSLRSALLSAANGGSATIHGKTKTAYPFLQAVNVDGSTVTSSNILEKLLDFYTVVRSKAKGTATKLVMSYKHLGSILKILELQNTGNSSVSVSGKKASAYGWDEIEINTVKGSLTLVAMQEWDDDIIIALNPKTCTFRSNGMFRKRKGPDGNEYFEVRNVTGYQYIVDVSLFGELEVTKPGENGVLYGISY